MGILKVFLMGHRVLEGHRNISKLYNGLQELKGVDATYIKKKWDEKIVILHYKQIYGQNYLNSNGKLHHLCPRGNSGGKI